MTDAITDKSLKTLLQIMDPIDRLHETGDAWGFGQSLRIDRRWAKYSDGFNWDLRPESHFYKRRFDFPDMGTKGCAIIFQAFPPIDPPAQRSEYFAGWVPLDREADADQWIAFLNAEIRDRLVTAGIEPHPPGAPDGAPLISPWPHEGRTLMLVGGYREDGEPDPRAPSILAAVGKGGRSSELRAAIAAYLRTAPRIVMTMGFSVDLLDPSQYAGSASIRADGVWAWPDTLAHYVEHDDVALPDAFERHLRERVALSPPPPGPQAPSGGAAKPRLKLVGNFRELGFLRRIDGEAPPSLVAARGAGRDEANRASVARYLRGGWELEGTMSQIGDVFETGTLAGHPGLLTDGVYAWPHFLGYYVDRYDVALPADFEERMRKRRWSPPMSLTTEGLVRP